MLIISENEYCLNQIIYGMKFHMLEIKSLYFLYENAS